MIQDGLNPEREVARHLDALRNAVLALANLHTTEPHELTGHQTVDAKQSLVLSFERLDACVTEMEEILATIVEATSNR